MLPQIVMGVIIALNIVGYLIVWMDTRTEFIKKANHKVVNALLIIVSVLMGFVGVFVAAEMYGYKRDEKWFKYGLKLIVFIEIVIICVVVYYQVR